MTTDRAPIRLNFWMTVCALPALMLLVGLGVWQLQRLEWKEALIAERAAGLAAPPVALEEILRANWRDFEFRKVSLEGRFLDNGRKLNTPVKVRNLPGYRLIAPFQTATGRTVLIDRGWIPLDWRQDDLDRSSGDLKLTGIVRTAGRSSRWTPDNVPEKGDWYYVDPGAMAARAGYANMVPFYIQALPEAPGNNGAASREAGRQIVFPLPLEFDAKQRNRHLEYAVTWFGLAATLVIIYIAYHWRRRQDT